MSKPLSRSTTPFRRSQPLMGTFAEMCIVSETARAELLELTGAVFAELSRLEAKYSFHRPDSRLSEINRYARQAMTVQLDPETADVMRHALAISATSEGRFDITVGAAMVALGALPGHLGRVSESGDWRDLRLDGARLSFDRPVLIDFGGIAKGYAVDRALDMLPQELEASVTIGGDLRTRRWRGKTVLLRGPARTVQHDMAMQAAAVATSVAAAGEHLAVLIDPRHGAVVCDRRSYSVFADSALLADALTKMASLGATPEHLWAAGACALVRLDVSGNVDCWQAPITIDSNDTARNSPCR